MKREENAMALSDLTPEQQQAIEAVIEHMQHDARYGHDFDWRAALQDSIERSKTQKNLWRDKLLVRCGEADEAGNALPVGTHGRRIDHNSGHGGNTAEADKFLPDGFWYSAEDRNGVAVEIFFASPEYLAASHAGNPWHYQCCVAFEGNRYAWAFGSTFNALEQGIVNPSGE